jgi:uncharacterized protein (DUF427 family)
MVKAVWNGKLIAEADCTEIVEGTHYFPSESLRREFFQPSDTHTICPWKGKAHYFTLLVGERRCRLVLPRTKARGAKDRRQSCLLARRSD